MCGRLVIAKNTAEIASLFEVSEVFATDLKPSYNLPPTQPVGMIIDRPLERDDQGLGFGETKRELHSARWGLVPRWAKEISGAVLNNARIETVLEKPSFREAALRQRCAVPVSGYYEWQEQDGVKSPHFIYAEGGMIALAGVYDWWRDPKKAVTDPERWVLSVTLLTKAAAGQLANIHDRTPIFLSSDSLDAWLDPSYLTDISTLEGMSEESDEVAEALSFHRVGAEVGAVKNDSIDLIRPI